MTETMTALPYERHREARAYLGLGGNIGDVRTSIREALAALSAGGAKVVRRSSDYETPPWGKTDQKPFVNAGAIVETSLSPHELLEKWGPRVIDIDVLAYEERVIETPDLIVPHRYMLERAFVLVPLAEIAPDLPVGGETVAEHARRFDATGIVKLEPEAGP